MRKNPMQSKGAISQFFDEVKRLCQFPFTIASGIFRLASLEMQLAKKSLMIMIGVFFFLLILGITCWLAINVLFITYLITSGFLLIGALLMIILFNILLAGLAIICLAKHSKSLSFSATRKELGLSRIKKGEL